MTTKLQGRNKKTMTEFIDVVAHYEDDPESFTDNERHQILEELKYIPLSFDDQKKLSSIKDTDFADIIEFKKTEIFGDCESVLEEAVDRGAESVEDICTWMGIDPQSSIKDIIYRMHAYRRLGHPGYPKALKV